MGIILDATNAQIVNAVRSEMVMFGGRIPEATASNIRDIGDIIRGNLQVANEFLSVLVRIRLFLLRRALSVTAISSKRFSLTSLTPMSMTRRSRLAKFISAKFLTSTRCIIR